MVFLLGIVIIMERTMLSTILILKKTQKTKFVQHIAYGNQDIRVSQQYQTLMYPIQHSGNENTIETSQVN